MKSLVFIRHAKSSWDEDLSDLQRPLSQRGIADAHLVASQFLNLEFKPDAIYCSPAVRAKSTCDIFVEELNFSDTPISIEKQLYDFGGDQVMRFIDSLDNGLEKVMIFGHNHAFTSLANALGSLYIDNLPTSGVVMLQFDQHSWKDLAKGKTQNVLRPRDFKSS